ncbi:MAG: HAD family phosphatase [Ruminococcaceae bacterium]|nr:HAD family phosphatase [Oscillospiraceae bacterium]
MNKKLIFLDIDGTLTRPGGTEPPESAVAAIRRARAAGHIVMLCTGRSPGLLQPLMRFGFDGAVACAGGHVFCGDRVIYDCPMTDEQVQRILRAFRAHRVFPTLETLELAYSDEGILPFLERLGGGDGVLVRWRIAMEKELNIRPMSEYDGRAVYKTMFMCESRAQLAPVRAELEDEFNFVEQSAFTSACLNGELINRRFHKGSGVRMAAEALGIPLADTIGFGDSLNDLEMFDTVGFGVCMENGHDEIKRLSDLICPPVEQDGLAWAFARLGLG